MKRVAIPAEVIAVGQNVRTLEPGDRRFATFNQTTLVDERTETLYVLLVSCSVRCYEDNKGTIDDVVESWTVKDR